MSNNRNKRPAKKTAEARWTKTKFAKKSKLLGRVKKRAAALEKSIQKAHTEAEERFQEKTVDLRGEITELNEKLTSVRERFVKRLQEATAEERAALQKLAAQRRKLEEQVMALSGAEILGDVLDEEDIDDEVDDEIEEALEESEDLVGDDDDDDGDVEPDDE